LQVEARGDADDAAAEVKSGRLIRPGRAISQRCAAPSAAAGDADVRAGPGRRGRCFVDRCNMRSAAMAGAGSADAVTNANAAVLAHSEVLIPNLNSTHFALAARHRRGPAEGPSGREAATWIFGECGADATEFHFVVCHFGRAAIAAGLRRRYGRGAWPFGHTQPSLRRLAHSSATARTQE
jgi:hypothetical protein